MVNVGKYAIHGWYGIYVVSYVSFCIFQLYHSVYTVYICIRIILYSFAIRLKKKDLCKGNRSQDRHEKRVNRAV